MTLLTLSVTVNSDQERLKSSMRKLGSSQLLTNLPKVTKLLVHLLLILHARPQLLGKEDQMERTEGHILCCNGKVMGCTHMKKELPYRIPTANHGAHLTGHCSSDCSQRSWESSESQTPICNRKNNSPSAWASEKFIPFPGH